MIPKVYIAEWRKSAPWLQDIQVEQDLLISRALVEIFQEPILANSLAFRGGTAFYKLFVDTPLRYSEDIDLVQIHSGPIGEIFTAIKRRLNPLLGEPQWKLNDGRATLFYKFTPEGIEGVKSKLKIEINTREHFSVYGLQEKKFELNSRWFSGNANIVCYHLDELMGTKLRALYQRRKGRDLFDLWVAIHQNIMTPARVIHAFQEYLKKEGISVTRAMFESNLAEKLNMTKFSQDITPLLSPTVTWDFNNALNIVTRELISLLPGEAWAGSIKSYSLV